QESLFGPVPPRSLTGAAGQLLFVPAVRGGVEGVSIKLPAVDPARLDEEWEADKGVLANLAENGDKPRIPRLVDVSFRGSEKDFERVVTIASQFGFVELDREEGEDGELYLFLECEQAVD